jgi:hypothetical protein
LNGEPVDAAEMPAVARGNTNPPGHGNRCNRKVHIFDMNPPHLKAGFLLPEYRARLLTPIQPPEGGPPACIFCPQEPRSPGLSGQPREAVLDLGRDGWDEKQFPWPMRAGVPKGQRITPHGP